jgi:hypothetical protein
LRIQSHAANFADEKFRRIPRGRNETSNAMLRGSVAWRICPSGVVIGLGLMS